MSSRLPTIVSIGFLAVSAAFITLNLVVDRSSFWAIWVIWAMGMVAAALIGVIRLAPHRLLGLWLGGGAVLQVGLFLIDLRDAQAWWFFWPLGAWVVGGMAIAGLTVNLLDSVPTSHPLLEMDDDPSSPSVTVGPAPSSATQQVRHSLEH